MQKHYCTVLTICFSHLDSSDPLICSNNCVSSLGDFEAMDSTSPWKTRKLRALTRTPMLRSRFSYVSQVTCVPRMSRWGDVRCTAMALTHRTDCVSAGDSCRFVLIGVSVALAIAAAAAAAPAAVGSFSHQHLNLTLQDEVLA